MKYKRSGGIILHPTSLAGPDGIGDLGPEAFHWIDFLKKTGCTLWQVLPLGPTGYGDSPYQCFSAFAGNPYLINPTFLLEEGLLRREDLADRPELPTEAVDFGPVINWKLLLLDRAFERFRKSTRKTLKTEFETFQISNSFWLDDFSLFMAIKEVNGGKSWAQWPLELRMRELDALARFQAENKRVIQKQVFRQFIFFRQWKAIHDYARLQGITIIGDVPIFVAYDSADAWSHPGLFFFNKKGVPKVVAGVPPDYFSPTGQLWGNPLYRWPAHKKDGYAWWLQRIKSTLQLFDIIRLDHFRGFAGYWEVPFGAPTAEHGRWVPGPGAHFFNAIKKELGDLPIIAEDLGEITPDVFALRDQFDLPGMKVLQFGFLSDPDDQFLPHNYVQNCVAYSGTHDNDTVKGWYDRAPFKEKDFCRRYFARSGDDISWDMIRGVWGSVAKLALAPMQDFLGLGNSARMNFPGKPSGNWSWRMAGDALSAQLIERIFEINWAYGRIEIVKKPK